MDRPYILLMYVQRMVYKRPFEHLGNLGLGTLAAFMEAKGYHARVFTGITTDAVSVFEEQMKRRPVIVVGLYCDYDNQSAVQSLSRFLKEKYAVHVIVGGPQTLFLGGDFIRKSKCDVLVRGDGEVTLFELTEWIAFGRGKLENIRGIVFLDESSRAVQTPEREPLTDLDHLPIPSTAHLLRRPIRYNLSVLSARGCPFRCAFCFEGSNTKLLRLRSVDSVKAEIRLGLEQNPGVKYVWFADDTFTLGYERVARFCEALCELRKTHDFVWFCEGHAKLLTQRPQLIQMMKDAGMAKMQIGMESGWQPALQHYGKRTTIEQIEKVVHLCWEANLPQLHGNFIVGGAYETEETLELTATYVEHLLNSAPGMLDISTTFVMPLPNTAIANCPAKFGLKILDAESLTSLEDFPVTETEKMTRNQINRARFVLVKRVSDTLKRLFHANKIPYEKIKTHFKLALHYGLSSSWYKYLYANNPITSQYFTMSVNTTAKQMKDIPRDDFMNWHPCTVFDIWQTIDWVRGRPLIGTDELTDSEYELLRLCNGKSSMRVIDEHLSGSIPNGGRAESGHESLRRILKKMDTRYWVVFFPP